MDDREHPLLRLGREDLERLHARLTQRNLVEIQPRAEPGPSRGLAHGARETGSPEVLQPFEQVLLDQLERGLDQQLLGERIADLHRRARLLAPFLERRGREHGDAPDPVAPGRRRRTGP